MTLRSGWNMPPGCFRVPGDEPDQPCDVCGYLPDDCLCPECPVCGDYGNPVCYEQHGLVRTQEQIDSLARFDAAQKEESERIAADERLEWEKHQAALDVVRNPNGKRTSEIIAACDAVMYTTWHVTAEDVRKAENMLCMIRNNRPPDPESDR